MWSQTLGRYIDQISACDLKVVYHCHFSERDACVSDCCDYETLSKSAKIRLKGIKLHDTELREFTSAESL